MKAVFRLFYYISILLTILLGIFTFLGGFARWISPESSLLVSLAGLIMPVLLVLNFLAAIYWTVRWRYWVFIPLVAIAWNWEYISNISRSLIKFPHTKEITFSLLGLIMFAASILMVRRTSKQMRFRLPNICNRKK